MSATPSFAPVVAPAASQSAPLPPSSGVGNTNSAIGWIKMAKGTRNQFIACFTLADKKVYSFTARLSQEVEHFACSQAVIYYEKETDLHGTRSIDHVDLGGFIHLSFENGPRVNGPLDDAVRGVHVQAQGTWSFN